MNENEKLIHGFYTCFQQLDWKGMTALYSDDIVFSDPGFGVLQGAEAKAMWAMLCGRAKNWSLQFGEVQADEEYGTCKWIANYTFGKTGRPVQNHIKAYMRFADGKIIEHTDEFNLYKWMRMALGIPGTLLGWTGFLQKKVRSGAMQQLEDFMRKQAAGGEYKNNGTK
jgi:ketosteroid isomerase-like protein